MMRDPMRMIRVGLACRFNMPPSEFNSRATNRDIIEILAYDLTQDEDWNKKQKREVERERSRTMTPEQQRAYLLAGLNNGNNK